MTKMTMMTMMTMMTPHPQEMTTSRDRAAHPTPPLARRFSRTVCFRVGRAGTTPTTTPTTTTKAPGAASPRCPLNAASLFDVPVQYIYRIISQGCHFYVETWGVTHPKAALVVKWYNFRLWSSRVITATVSLSQAQAIGFDPQRRTSALGIMSIDYSLLEQQELFAIRGRFGFDSRRALTFTYPSFCFLCSNTLSQLALFHVKIIKISVKAGGLCGVEIYLHFADFRLRRQVRGELHVGLVVVLCVIHEERSWSSEAQNIAAEQTRSTSSCTPQNTTTRQLSADYEKWCSRSPRPCDLDHLLRRGRGGRIS